MLWLNSFANKQSVPAIQMMSIHAQIAVFVVLVLASLPAIIHLPVWVTVVTLVAVSWKFLSAEFNKVWLDKAIIALLLIVGLLGIVFSYASWFGGDAILSFFVIVVALKWSESNSQRDGLLMIFAAMVLSAIGGMYWQTLMSMLHMLLVALFLLLALVALNDVAGHFNWKKLLFRSALLFFLALPLMALLFVTLPRIPGPVWDIGLAFGIPVNLSVKKERKGPLIGKKLKVGQITPTSESNDVVLVAEFSNNFVPLKSRMYWRGPVFYDFDGVNWQLDQSIDAGKAMNRSGFRQRRHYDEFIRFKRSLVSYSARVSAHQDHWLYALELPYGSFPETRISPNFQLTSARPLKQGEFKYEMTGYLDFEISMPLSDSHRNRSTFLPQGSNPGLLALGKQIGQDHDSIDDVMQAVFETYVSSEFEFDEQAGVINAEFRSDEQDNSGLDKFFFKHKRGNAMHFASSLVMIMRAAGVPSRLVTGFRGGDLIALTDFVIVRNKHAHVWTEIWHPDRGWLRMEIKDIVAPPALEKRGKKTVGLKNTDDTGTQVQLDKVEKTSVTGNKPVAVKEPISPKPDETGFDWSQFNLSLEKWVLNYNPNRQLELFSSANNSKVIWSDLLLWAILGVALLMIVYGAAIHWFQRHKEGEVSLAWHRFLTSLKPLGIATSATECPTMLQHRIASTRPDLAPGTTELIERYLDIRYGSQSSTDKDGEFVRLVKRFVMMV